jgi:hypothetical protein
MTVHEDTNSHSHDRLCDVKQIQQTSAPRYSLLQLCDDCQPCKRIKKRKVGTPVCAYDTSVLFCAVLKF